MKKKLYIRVDNMKGKIQKNRSDSKRMKVDAEKRNVDNKKELLKIIQKN